MDSILEMYLFETNSLLEQLDSIALAAEEAGTFSQNSVDEIFRIMHTIKGASAMMEYSGLMTVAHRIEDMFFIVRENSMEALSEQTRSELFDLMFKAIDYFRGEVTKLESNQPLSENIDSFVVNINSLIPKIKADIEGTPLPTEWAPSEAGTPVDAVLANGSEEYPHALLIFFDEGSGMESLRAFMLVSSIRDYCNESDFTYSPADVETNPDSSELIVENGFLLFFRTAQDRDHAIHAVTDSGSVRNYEIHDYEVPNAAQPQSSAAAESQPVETSTPDEETPPAAPPRGKPFSFCPPPPPLLHKVLVTKAQRRALSV